MAVLAALSQPAMAQEALQQSAPQAEENRMGEIVVTARFVSENIQDTPMAITAQTSAQLEAANVASVGTLGSVVPNLQTVPGDSQSAGTPLIRMRGVIQGDSSSLAVPPALAIYTDDIYHATTAGSDLDFTDIERVEVNRGPQSTLSGNASIGGAIKIYTVDPRGDGSGYLQVTGGSRKKLGISGALDIGLSSTLSMRASGNFERQDGFGNRLDFACMMDKLGTPELKGSLGYFQSDSANRNCVLGHTGGGTKAVGQVKLRWQPNADVDFILTARHREEDMEETPEIALSFQPACITEISGPSCNNSAGAQAYHRAVMNAFGFLPDDRFVVPERNGGRYDTYATNCRPLLDTTETGGFPAGYPFGVCYDPRKTASHTLLSGKLRANLSDHVRMTAIAGYTEYANAFTQNGDQSPLGYVISHFRNNNNQLTGEIRFDGKLFDDKLNWVVGGFTMRMEGEQRNMLTFLNIYQLAEVYGVNDSRSAFFHLDYNLTENWRVSGGMRYTDSSIAITTRNPQTVGNAGFTNLGASVNRRWDWLMSSDFKVTDDIMVYASAASGSRPPGVTTIVSTPRQYGPTAAEDLISYEAGIKADLFDRRLRTNLTGFYMDYRKISSPTQGIECRNQPGPVATWFPETAATDAARERCSQFPGLPDPIRYDLSTTIPAKIKGVEWEITAMPIDGLRIDWLGGYNNYKSGVKTPGQPGYLFPGNYRQPEWNMHANISYDIETGAGTFTPRLDWNWQSKQTFDVGGQTSRPPAEIFVIRPYSLFNAQIAYQAPARDWSAVLSVTNLANRWHHYQVFQGSVNAQTRVGAPREFALTVRRSF